MRTLVPLTGILLVGFSLASAASAAEPAEWQVGVTGFGLVNGSFLTEPADEDKFIRQNGSLQPVLYPGFGGVGGGGGFSISGTWRGILGLEFGPYWSLDQGDGSLQVDNFEIDFTVSQVSTHLPLVLRLTAPIQVVRPFLFGGPEWVVPGDPEAESTPSVGFIAAEADTYLAWTFGLGFDFLLPVEGHDIRIPFTIKGLLHPVDETAEGRVSYSCGGANLQCPPVVGPGDQIVYNTEWEWQAIVSLGVAYYFDM